MKFERPNSNIVPFGVNATENKRFAFGTQEYTNDINDNLNDNFKLGWETVGINSKPPRQWFNGLSYTSTYLTSYLFQTGIPEWNDKQEYYINSITKGSNGELYRSLTGAVGTPNVGKNPLTEDLFWKSTLDDVVKTTGNQTINGIKTFTSNVLTPSTSLTATNNVLATADYVRNKARLLQTRKAVTRSQGIEYTNSGLLPITIIINSTSDYASVTRVNYFINGNVMAGNSSRMNASPTINYASVEFEVLPGETWSYTALGGSFQVIEIS